MAFLGGLGWIKERFWRGIFHSSKASAPLIQPLSTHQTSAYAQCQSTLDNALFQLLEEPDAKEPFLLILNQIEECTGAEASILLLEGNETDGHPEILAATEPQERWQNLASQGSLPLLGPEPYPGIIRVTYPGEVEHNLLQVQISDPSQNHGYLILRTPTPKPFSPQEYQFLKTLAGRLGPVMISTRRAKLKRRLALYEERAAIARELHDSLAQSLSYLMIQTSRLQAKLEDTNCDISEENDRSKLESVLQDLRTNLNVSYRQLREIINTFRLTLEAPNLEQEISNTIEEYEKLSGIAFSLDYRIPGDQLTANEEVQAFLIVREALSNLVRHSHARQGWISVFQGEEQKIHVTVEDDGVGLSDSSSWDGSHGLNNMQERAKALEGGLTVEPRSEGGTQVRLSFLPARLSHHAPSQESPHTHPEKEKQA
ncbi:histidine kinase [Thiohalorhabdus methylotrophus]|uniref:histidine kinase n=1 Tax=Thiohalorhabdus methylotrophus TaxID=3242694 RepID=A0ABV4TXF3_9GAMM